MLPTDTAKTFKEDTRQQVLPYVTSQLQYTSRVDVVCDEYLTDSLKADTRKKRGTCKGVRRRVDPPSSIPGNCLAFLCTDDNKMELFDFLATRVAEIDTDKQVISTYHKYVVCTQARDVDGLLPCSHEEDDTRILLHVQDVVRQGYSKVLIPTVDTDVIVLAVTAAGRLDIEEP